MYDTEEIVGHEALCGLPNPSLIFVGASPEFELKCLLSALCQGRILMNGGLLFVNISAGALLKCRPRVLGALENLPPGRVVVEITERDPGDIAELTGAAEEIRAVGQKVALDDFGSGSSVRFLDIGPDYLKVDMAIVRNCHLSAQKQSLLKTVASWSGIFSVAEGIETKEEYKTCLKAGINYFQGYYLCRPYFLGGGEERANARA
nr:EAL domain-containing protein [Syntrophothermus sp.]